MTAGDGGTAEPSALACSPGGGGYLTSDVGNGQDDRSVTGGTAAAAEPPAAVVPQTVARRHVGGFAMLRMFPMAEFYLLHVYVLLQLALFGR